MHLTAIGDIDGHQTRTTIPSVKTILQAVFQLTSFVNRLLQSHTDDIEPSSLLSSAENLAVWAMRSQ